jgi:hypothetical protein
MRCVEDASLRADSASNPRSAVLANLKRQAGELAAGHECSRARARRFRTWPPSGRERRFVLNEPRADTDHFTPGLKGANP